MKFPFMAVIVLVYTLVNQMGNDGMSAMFIAKKLWIQGFLSVMIFCHSFGLVIRIATYLAPYLVFYEKF